MAQFSIEIPDNIVMDVINTCCTWLNYPATVEVSGEVVANPVTPGQFLNKNVRDYIREMYKAQKVKESTSQALADAQAIADTIVIIDPASSGV